jgi:plastocyanin
VLITIVGIAGSMSYDPNPATVRVGQTVAWRNADSIPHTSSQVGTGGFDTGTVAGGATSQPIRMTAPGSLDYFCRIHPSMVARIDVAP